MLRNYRPGIATLVISALLLAAPAVAAESLLPVWRVDGDANRVYLLGSVHFLRASDYPLPAAVQEVYRETEVLLMELDMDDLDPRQSSVLAAELGMLPGECTLADRLGPDGFAELARLAASAGIPLPMLQKAKPWFAAINIEQILLGRAGFDATLGIEAHFAGLAAKDGKEILGLETLRQQLGLLDGLSPEAQRALLFQTLQQARHVERRMDRLLDAWRNGDTAFLDTAMLGDMQENTELYRTLLVDRNKAWLGQIDTLLSEVRDFLVIVGTAHLLGDDGLPRLLEKRGRRVIQLRQSGAPPGHAEIRRRKH